MNIIDNDLLSIQESRILVENAREAQGKLAAFSQEKLDEIVERMAEELEKHLSELARMSKDETGYGKWEDKYVKNKFVLSYLTSRLKGMKCVGIISEDETNQTMDIGVPVGVIVALCPSTSPVSTTLYKALIAIKSGNAIIFSPHPRAKRSITRALDILIRAAEGYGLPEGALAYLQNVTAAGTLALMNHEDASLIINTGVPGLLKAAYQSGKPVIYGGTGNSPAFIEASADIQQAVKDIIASKTFDNGVASGAEQSIVVDRRIEPEVQNELKKNGAYFMSEEESSRLEQLLFHSDGSAKPVAVGKTARQLAKMAGFNVPDNIRILISKQKYVSKNNPYVREKLCPVLAYYIEDDWIHACEKCIELLLSDRHGHTLVIHSRDEAVIRQFALKKPVGRMLVNTPGALGSMGATTNLFPSMTLGSGSAGHGMTSDNVSPKNLIYVRKVGYGVRTADEMMKGKLLNNHPTAGWAEVKECDTNEMEWLESVLKKVLENLK